jgi:hypothetical protein
MYVRVTVRKKGRLCIEPSYAAPEHELRDLAHMVREFRGVKRAIVRPHKIYVRIDVSVSKLRERIVRTAKRFFYIRHDSVAAQRPLTELRVKPACVRVHSRRNRLALPGMT